MQTLLTKSAPGFYSWSFYNPEVKAECFSHVFIHDQSLIVIDPSQMPDKMAAELKKLGTPVVILLTNGNHSRASQQLKKQWMVPIGAAADAIEELQFVPEIIVDSLVQIHGLKPIALPGGAPGEFAFYSAKTKTMVVGDAIINTGSSGLAVLPDKYCNNPALLKRSLRKLLEFDFENLLMAHGEPLIESAHFQIETLLNT